MLHEQRYHSQVGVSHRLEKPCRSSCILQSSQSSSRKWPGREPPTSVIVSNHVVCPRRLLYCMDMTNPASPVTTDSATTKNHQSPPKLPPALLHVIRHHQNCRQPTYCLSPPKLPPAFFFFFGFFLLCLGGVHQPYVLSVTTKIATSLIVSHCHQLLLNLPQHRLSVTNGTIIMLCFQGL